MSARARPGGRARTKGPHHFGTAVVLAKLKEYGLLLQTDVNLPNGCALVAGAPVRGSWWGHPPSHEIFRVNCELGEHPDVLGCQRGSGKRTGSRSRRTPERARRHRSWKPISWFT